MTQTADYESKTSPTAITRSRQALAGVLEFAIRLAALGVVFGAFALLVPGGKFVTASNIENLLMQSAVYAMCGLGMTMIIITGGIDLSAGSAIALSMVVTSMILNGGVDGTGGAAGIPPNTHHAAGGSRRNLRCRVGWIGARPLYHRFVVHRARRTDRHPQSRVASMGGLRTVLAP